MMVVQYNGAHFFGWQKQNGKRTVQGELEQVFSKVTKQNCEVVGSGRTDRGVHAIGQVATVDIDSTIPLKNLKLAVNNMLSGDVLVKSMKVVSGDFNPRFAAKRKTYRYVVGTGKRDAFKDEFITYYTYKVDLEKMQNAAKLLVGRHNFKAFCSADTEVSDFVREIYSIDIKKVGQNIIFEITGNGFLYNMVRIIVGTLLQIDRIGEENIKLALENGDRALVGKTMPPNGLYLKKVEYK